MVKKISLEHQIRNTITEMVPVDELLGIAAAGRLVVGGGKKVVGGISKFITRKGVASDIGVAVGSSLTGSGGAIVPGASGSSFQPPAIDATIAKLSMSSRTPNTPKSRKRIKEDVSSKAKKYDIKAQIKLKVIDEGQLLEMFGRILKDKKIPKEVKNTKTEIIINPKLNKNENQ